MVLQHMRRRGLEPGEIPAPLRKIMNDVSDDLRHGIHPNAAYALTSYDLA